MVVWEVGCGRAQRAWSSGAFCLVSVPPLPLGGCVTLDKSLQLSVPRFPRLENGHSHGTSLTGNTCRGLRATPFTVGIFTHRALLTRSPVKPNR